MIKTIRDNTGKMRKVITVSRDTYFEIRQNLEREYKTELDTFILDMKGRPERLNLGEFILEINPHN